MPQGGRHNTVVDGGCEIQTRRNSIGEQGIGFVCKRFQCFNTVPCRPVPLLTHFGLTFEVVLCHKRIERASRRAATACSLLNANSAEEFGCKSRVTIPRFPSRECPQNLIWCLRRQDSMNSRDLLYADSTSVKHSGAC